MPVAWTQEVKQGEETQKQDSVPVVVNSHGLKNTEGLFCFISVSRKINFLAPCTKRNQIDGKSEWTVEVWAHAVSFHPGSCQGVKVFGSQEPHSTLLGECLL